MTARGLEVPMPSLRQFVLGIPVEGQAPLNETDQYLMFNLYSIENSRRNMSRDAFSLNLQERRERNAPFVRQGDRYAITIGNWIDMFQLRLIAR